MSHSKQTILTIKVINNKIISKNIKKQQQQHQQQKITI